MSGPQPRTLLVCASLALGFLAPGCVNDVDPVSTATTHMRLDRDNYERICLGMSRADVETLIGKPTRTSAQPRPHGEAVATWREGRREWVIRFDAGKVGDKWVLEDGRVLKTHPK